MSADKGIYYGGHIPCDYDCPCQQQQVVVNAVSAFPSGLTPQSGDDDCDYDDDYADAMTPDKVWTEGGIKD